MSQNNCFEKMNEIPFVNMLHQQLEKVVASNFFVVANKGQVVISDGKLTGLKFSPPNRLCGLIFHYHLWS